MSDSLLKDIRADLRRFSSGADPTLDVEDIHLLMARYERMRKLLERMLAHDDAVQMAWGTRIRAVLR